jgi:L-lactate dehydrogenase complex protein LldF
VRIDLHHQLLTWRAELASQNLVPLQKRLAGKVSRFVLARKWAYVMSGKMARLFMPKFLMKAWTRGRELPVLPRETFREQWRKRNGKP